MFRFGHRLSVMFRFGLSVMFRFGLSVMFRFGHRLSVMFRFGLSVMFRFGISVKQRLYKIDIRASILLVISRRSFILICIPEWRCSGEIGR